MQTTKDFEQQQVDGLPSEMVKAAWNFLGCFYDLLDEGVPEKIFAVPDREFQKFKRGEIFKNVRKQNSFDIVCRACDSQNYFSNY